MDTKVTKHATFVTFVSILPSLRPAQARSSGSDVSLRGYHEEAKHTKDAKKKSASSFVIFVAFGPSWWPAQRQDPGAT